MNNCLKPSVLTKLLIRAENSCFNQTTGCNKKVDEYTGYLCNKTVLHKSITVRSLQLHRKCISDIQDIYPK